MLRRIGDLLDQNRDFSPVLRWHEWLQRLDAALSPHLPSEMRRSVRVASQEGQRLVLVARHAAAAARLRQLTPRLVNALREKGIPVLEITVKVDTTLQAQRPQFERHLTPHALKSLAELQKNLPDGPLKAAVASLSGKGRKT